MVRERTRLGLQAARERGRIGGRKPKLTSHQRAEAVKMVTTGAKSAAEVARLFRVHRSSISRLMGRRRPRINRAYYFFCDAEASLSALSSFVLVGDDLKVVGELQVGNRVTP